MPEAVAQRIVPGAPPPAPLTKNQKKKRKGKGKSDQDEAASIPDTTSAALIEKAPEPSDIQEGAVAPELIARSESQAPIPEDDLLLKLSPIVDLVHKRLKATTKKIVSAYSRSSSCNLFSYVGKSRMSVYAATDPEKLNDDQKRSLKTLPTLEAVQKELGEVKKAIEVGINANPTVVSF